MPLPTGWPPRVASGRRSIRFYQTGTATALFADRAYLFADQATANTFSVLPFVNPGQESPVVVPLPPMGGGANAADSLSDPRIGTAIAPPPHPMIWANTIRIIVLNNVALEISFDGTTVQGIVPAVTAGPTEVIYRDRYEAGIAVRGNTAQFIIEAW